MTEIRESAVEDYLVEQVEEAGGEARKVQWIGRSNAPDRLILLNGACFCEVKRPGKFPTAAQYREIDRINESGGKAVWVNSYEMVDTLIEELCGKK